MGHWLSYTLTTMETPAKPETRVPKTFSLLPRHLTAIEGALRARADLGDDASKLIRELIDKSLDPETGRAREYLHARDAALQFEEDCAASLTAAGMAVARNCKAAGGHRVDMIVAKGAKKCIVERSRGIAV